MSAKSRYHSMDCRYHSIESQSKQKLRRVNLARRIPVFNVKHVENHGYSTWVVRIISNPPFGKNRSLDLSNSHDLEVSKLYELYGLYTETNPKAGLDKGVVFLENAVRQIKEGGRFAIVLSNAIMSNNTWQFVRQWLLKKVRIVALFDLPENVFAETGVNTTILVGYKPSQDKLRKLINDDYSVFTRDVLNVGYKKKTSKRTVKFDNDYALDPDTFETVTNDEGESVLNEDFSQIVKEFKEWCLNQELALKKLFLE